MSIKDILQHVSDLQRYEEDMRLSVVYHPEQASYTIPSYCEEIFSKFYMTHYSTQYLHDTCSSMKATSLDDEFIKNFSKTDKRMPKTRIVLHDLLAPTKGSYSVLSDILYKIQSSWVPVEIFAMDLNILVINAGGQYKPKPMEPGALGRLIISLPSNFVGGQFVLGEGTNLRKISFEENCQKLNWLVSFGDSLKECLPVKSGTMVLITMMLFPFKQADQKELAGSTKYIESRINSLFKKINLTGEWSCNPQDGPADITSQHTHLQHIKSSIRSLVTPSMGFILSEKYDSKSVTIEDLKGSDKVVFDYFTNQKDFSVQLEAFILCFDMDGKSYVIHPPGSNIPQSTKFFSAKFLRREVIPEQKRKGMAVVHALVVTCSIQQPRGSKRKDLEPLDVDTLMFCEEIILD